MEALTTIRPAGAEPLTMTSREIAELTGKRHDHVLRDARAMLAELHGDGGVPSFGATYRDPQNGQEYPMLALPKRETLILVSGYSVQMRARIIDRWQELEQQAAAGFALPDFTDPATAAVAWAEQFRAKQALQLANEAQAQRLKEAEPKARALDVLASSDDGSVCIRVAAKLLQMPERDLFRELHARNWIFRHHHSNTWQGYSDKAKAGLLELKLTRVERSDGTEKTVEQVKITRRGLAKLALILQRPIQQAA